MEHINLGIVFLFIGNSQTNSDQLFITQSKIPLADWLILGLSHALLLGVSLSLEPAVVYMSSIHPHPLLSK